MNQSDKDILFAALEVQPRKARRKVDSSLLPVLFKDCSESTKQTAKELISVQWEFITTHQRRGWCHHKYKQIAIPAWVISSTRIGYKEYYICHEMSHALCPVREQHGPLFMDTLKGMCPPEFIHYELEYKPRNATSAGIGRINPDFSLL